MADSGESDTYGLHAGYQQGFGKFPDTGITCGLGVDYKLADGLTAGAEDSRSDSKDVLQDSAGLSGNDPDLNQVQVCASCKF